MEPAFWACDGLTSGRREEATSQTTHASSVKGRWVGQNDIGACMREEGMSARAR